MFNLSNAYRGIIIIVRIIYIPVLSERVDRELTIVMNISSFNPDLLK